MSTQNLFPVDRSILAESAGAALGRFIGLNFVGGFTLRDRGNFLEVEAPAAVTPGGADGLLQYNNGGVFGGTTGIAYNDGTQILESQRIFRFGAGATFAVNPWLSFPGNVLSDIIGWRNIAGTADHIALANDGGDTLWIGSKSDDTNRVQSIRCNPTGAFVQLIAGSSIYSVQAGSLQFFDSVALIQGTTNPASSGDYRVRNGYTKKARNAGNTANILVAQVDASDYLWLGDNAANTESTDRTQVRANNVVALGVQGGVYAQLDSQEFAFRTPLVGYVLGTSPYGVHGGFDHTFAADANYTVTAAQYAYDFAQFNTGAITAGRTVTWPHPSSLIRGYYKTIFNNTTQTLTISTGTGTTRTLATTLAQRFYLDSTGVRFAGPTFTP